MELGIIFRAVLSFALVLLVMYILLKLMQRYTKLGTCWSSNRKNLKVEQVLFIDEGTKLINVSNADLGNYIIAIGKNNIVLIDKYKTHQEERNEPKL